jgi:DNA-binding Xre family transcriptional regulator
MTIIKDMGISYRPLFHTLVDKGLKKTDLIELAGISAGTIARFAKGEEVSLTVIDKICNALDCEIGDVIEHITGKG